MQAATHWNSTASSSNVSTGRCSSTIDRNGALDRTWVRKRAIRAAERMGLSRKIPLALTASHARPRARIPSTDGSAATKAPLRAPMLVPDDEVGTHSLLGQRAQHPHLGRTENAPTPENECRRHDAHHKCES